MAAVNAKCVVRNLAGIEQLCQSAGWEEEWFRAFGAGRFNGGEEEAAFQSNSSVAHTVVVHPIGDTLAALKKLTCNPRKPIKEPSADADNVVLVEQGFALDPSVAQPCWKCKKPGHKCPKKAQKARKRRGGRRSAK